MMRLIKRKEIIDYNYKVNLISILVSSGFFTGYLPFASGTFGSAFAVLILFIPLFNNSISLLLLSIIIFIVGIFTSSDMMKRYGNDPSVVVIDEIVGMWISLAINMIFINEITLLNIILAFTAFRFFDIFKIYPARFFDNMKNGIGIMMDDVIAGIYSGLISVFLYIFIKYIW